MKKFLSTLLLALFVTVAGASLHSCDGDSGTSSVSESGAVQCKGYTEEGLRCKRKTTNPSGYCWQHE